MKDNGDTTTMLGVLVVILAVDTKVEDARHHVEPQLGSVGVDVVQNALESLTGTCLLTL